MPLWPTSNAAFADNGSDTVRSKAFAVPVECMGLKPNTQYTFYLDGVEFGWAVKPWGKDLGDTLIADAEGKLRFTFLYDFQYEGNYAFDNIPETPASGAQYNNSQQDQLNYYMTNRFLELKGPGSYVSAYFPVRLLIIPAHVNRIESHAH